MSRVGSVGSLGQCHRFMSLRVCACVEEPGPVPTPYQTTHIQYPIPHQCVGDYAVVRYRGKGRTKIRVPGRLKAS